MFIKAKASDKVIAIFTMAIDCPLVDALICFCLFSTLMTCARSLAHLSLTLWLVSIGLLGRKVDGAKFLAKFFMGTHAWVLSASDLGIVEVG